MSLDPLDKLENRGGVANYIRHTNTHYIYNNDMANLHMDCDTTALDNCLKKFLKDDANVVPEECRNHIESWKTNCGIRRGTNLLHILVRNDGQNDI